MEGVIFVVNKLNNAKDNIKISLTAGGVGLNLVGTNHLNPSRFILESTIRESVDYFRNTCTFSLEISENIENHV